MAVMGKAKEAGLPLMKLIKLRGMPILQQLHLEERLLRTSSDNWCLINDGTNSPPIVTGLSGCTCINREVYTLKIVLGIFLEQLSQTHSVKSISLESIDVPSVSEYAHTTKLLTEQRIQETCTIQT